MNSKQNTNEQQPRTSKLNERDLQGFFNVQYTYLRSIELARTSALRYFGPAVDLPNDLPKTEHAETVVANVNTIQTQETVQPVAQPEVITQKTPEVAVALAASAVNATEASENASNLDLAAIRERVSNSLNSSTSEPDNGQSDYDLAA